LLRRVGTDEGGSTLTEEQRVMLSADDIFTLYLGHVSQLVNSEFIKTVLHYIIMYRDCLNQYGWQKVAEADLRETKQPLDEANIQQRMLLRKDMQNMFEYCTCNNAECIPEICNEFVTMYMPSRRGSAAVLE
jgi:hypothetical protein